jgi:hypothetical protein
MIDGRLPETWSELEGRRLGTWRLTGCLFLYENHPPCRSYCRCLSCSGAVRTRGQPDPLSGADNLRREEHPRL